MIHSFRLSTGAVTLVSALAVAGFAPGLPAPAHAADGQPVPVRPRWRPDDRPKSLVRPARPAKADKVRKKRRARPVASRQPEIRLDMGGPEGPLIPGRTYDWPYSITNLGPGRTDDVVFVAPLPYGLEYVSGRGDCAMQGPRVLCSVGSLPRGETYGGVITTKVWEHVRTDSPIRGDVTVKWSNGTTHGAFPTTSVSTASDLVVTSTGPAQVQPGGQITHTFTVENRGPSTATGVTVNTPGTSADTQVTPTSGQGCAVQGGGFTCQIGTLAVQETRTFTVVFKARPEARPGLVVCRFDAVSDTPDLHPDDNHTLVRPNVVKFRPVRDGDHLPGPGRPRPLPEAPEAPEAPAPAPAAPVSAPRSAVQELPDTGGDTQARVDLALAFLGTGLILVGIGARRRRADAGQSR